MNAHSACVTGVLTNLSNPKAVVFFASVFAHFIEPGLSLGWALTMALFLIIAGITWFAGLTLFLRTSTATVLHNTAFIDIIAGSYAAFRTISLH